MHQFIKWIGIKLDVASQREKFVSLLGSVAAICALIYIVHDLCELPLGTGLIALVGAVCNWNGETRGRLSAVPALNHVQPRRGSGPACFDELRRRYLLPTLDWAADGTAGQHDSRPPVIDRMHTLGISIVPVVTRNNPQKLVGYLGRTDILAARPKALGSTEPSRARLAVKPRTEPSSRTMPDVGSIKHFGVSLTTMRWILLGVQCDAAISGST